MAKELYEEEGELEFDESPKVSLGDDPGAYVQCWIWVPPDRLEKKEETVTCRFCGKAATARTAHLHLGTWVGDECCWDERLRTTE